MIVTCNECESSFNVDDNLIKDTGSKFRCSKCNSVFTAFPEALEPVDDDVVAEAGDDLESDDLDTRLEDLLGDEPVEPDALSEDMNDEFDLDLDFDLDDEDVEEAFAVDAEPVDSDGEMLEIDDDLGTEKALADSSDEL
ncbi:MAG: zinc-ribbon domain-containing protein, partial [Desulfobacterales bacterium]